jgi:3-oxoacyl-[acyl-carrier protein] reductase
MAQRPDEARSRIPGFGEIAVGFTRSLTHTLTEDDVTRFAELTGDFNPMHVDPAFARRTSLGRPIVHGMLSASFISTMIGMLLPGPGALWVAQTLEFLQPAYVGDTLTVTATVKQKSAGTRLLVLDMTIINGFGHELLRGEATVRLLEVRPDSQEGGMSDRKSKVVLITGGSRGIGAATVRRLVAADHSVVVNYLNAETEARRLVDEVRKAGGQVIAVRGDVSNEADVEGIFRAAEEAFAPVDAVVHCAAPTPIPQPFEDLQFDTLVRQFDVQVRGAFLCAKRALPAMVKAQTGSLVLVGSIFAEGTPPPQQAAYVVAKAALAALARSLAVEYGPKGVRVNVVAPGMTQTDMLAHIPEKTKALARMNTPLRRLGDPNDVAEVVAFLVGPGSRHVSGETIRVCGGLAM